MSSLEKYFETFTSDSTITSYKAALKRYFSLFYGDGDLATQVERYASEDRDHEDDIRQYFISLQSFAPVTIRQYLNVVKNFLEETQNREFPRRFISGLLRRSKGSKPLTQDRAPTKEELRSILSHLDLKGTTLVLVMTSSGMRIGETLQVKLSDIDLNNSPCEISIRAEYTKTGNSRTTFLSQKAKESILQWLRVRDRYMEYSRSRYYKTKEDYDNDRLFPFSESTARAMWSLALKKAGLDDQDPRTKYHKLRLHSLRKFFKTQLSKVDNAGEMPEALLGHIDAYLRYSREEYREFYLRAEHAVTVFGGADLLELSETKGEIENLKNVMLKLLEENQQLKERIARVEKLGEEFERMQREINVQLERLSARARGLCSHVGG